MLNLSQRRRLFAAREAALAACAEAATRDQWTLAHHHAERAWMLDAELRAFLTDRKDADR